MIIPSDSLHPTSYFFYSFHFFPFYFSGLSVLHFSVWVNDWDASSLNPPHSLPQHLSLLQVPSWSLLLLKHVPELRPAAVTTGDMDHLHGPLAVVRHGGPSQQHTRCPLKSQQRTSRKNPFCCQTSHTATLCAGEKKLLNSTLTLPHGFSRVVTYSKQTLF